MEFTPEITAFIQFYGIHVQLDQHLLDKRKEQVGDLNTTQRTALYFVYAFEKFRGESINQKELSKWLQLTPSATSYLITALVKKKLLRRFSDPEHKRCVRISMGELGCVIMEQVILDLHGLLEKITAYVNPDDMKAFCRVIGIFYSQLLNSSSGRELL